MIFISQTKKFVPWVIVIIIAIAAIAAIALMPPKVVEKPIEKIVTKEVVKEVPVTKIELRVLLPWYYTISMSHLYAAQDKGYFDKMGLDVKLIEGGTLVAPVKALAAGAIDFGVIGQSDVISARTLDIPVKAILTDWQKEAGGYASLRDRPDRILTPKDWVGKTIATLIGTDDEYILKAMMNNELTPAQINTIKIIPGGWSQSLLLEGKVDVQNAWKSNLVEITHATNVQFDWIAASDYGIKTYAQLFATTDKMIKEQPDVVLKFTRALCRGMEDMKNSGMEDQIIDIAFKRIPEEFRDRKLQSDLLHTYLWGMLSDVTDKYGWGWQTKENYEWAQNFYYENAEIEKKLPVDDFYTNQFLEQIYTKDGKVIWPG